MNQLSPSCRRRFGALLVCVTAWLSTSGCSKFDLLNATVPSCGYKRTGNIAFGPEPRQTLDVYRPKAVAKAPVVVFFYGGYWISGDKADYRFAAQALTSRGFVAVLPDYGKYPEVTFPTFIQDGAQAIRWVHDHIDHFGGDASRIYLMGHSAGAQIAVLLAVDGKYLKAVGLDRSDIRGVAGVSGPYDFDPPDVSRGAFNMKPGDTKPDPQIQAINFIDGHQPPLLVVTGDTDDVVNPGNAQRIANRVRTKGGFVRHVVYRKIGHVQTVLALAAPFRWICSVLDESAAFFKAH